jgi:hypothetical protein
MDAAAWTAIGWTAIGLLAATSLGSLFYLGARIDGLGARIDAMGTRSMRWPPGWMRASTRSKGGSTPISTGTPGSGRPS